ncbi:MAG: pilus assembly protein TadG-related protein [Actinomycetota bacterium]
MVLLVLSTRTRRGPNERGSVLILVSLSMTVLVGFSALAIDLGFARQRRTQARSSADFAALAGAGVLKTGTIAEAEAAARDFASRNGFSGEDAEVNIPPTSGSKSGVAGCVQVKPSEQFPTIFGRIFNVGTITVASGAVACSSPGLGGPYAVFAGSTTCASAVSFSGSNRTINGGVHSNNDMKITSSGTVINGAVDFLNGDAPAGNITFNPSTDNPTRLTSPLPYPEFFAIGDYAPGGAKALLAQSQGKYYNAGSLAIDEVWLTSINPLFLLNKTIPPGLYYTTGAIHLNTSGITGTGVTLVTSNGDVKLNGNNLTFTPWDPDGLLIFSNKTQSSCSSGQAVIALDGNTHSWTGIMFAPNGPLDFSGTNVVASLNGRLVAKVVSLSGSSQTITRNLSYPGRSDGFELAE